MTRNLNYKNVAQNGSGKKKVSHFFNRGITCIFAAVLALADFS